MDAATLSKAKKLIAQAMLGYKSYTFDDTTNTLTFTMQDGQVVKIKFGMPAQGPQGDKGDKGEDGIYPVTININASNHLIFTMSDTSVIDAGEVNLSYDDTELRRLITTVSDNLGDMTTLEVTGVLSIVEALNKINNQFMKNVTYANKKLTLEYKNGIVYDIDVSSVITDTSIGELRDVLLTTPADGEVLTYDAATSKFVNKENGHTDLLDVAKKYTDDQIVKTHEASAEIVSSKPSADQATEMTEYYYKNADGNWMKTMYIGGIEVTINPGAVNLDNCVMKTDVLSAFDELFAETDKVIDTSYFKEAYNKLVTNIGLKVSTADIVDNLLSELTDVPLSAAQGKALKTLIDGIAASIKTHTDDTNIHTTAAEKKANTDHIADTDIHVTKELKDKLLTTDDITETIDSSSTNAKIPGAKIINDMLGSKYGKQPITTLNNYTTVLEWAKNNIGNSVGYAGKNFDDSPLKTVYGTLVCLGNAVTTGLLVIIYTNWNESIYVRKIKGNNIGNATWVTEWERVCTTTVADVDKTTITFSDETNYKVMNCQYIVRNGMCTMTLYVQCVSPSDDWVNLANIPKPAIPSYTQLHDRDNHRTPLRCAISSTGKLQIIRGEADGYYLNTFSYHVAES